MKIVKKYQKMLFQTQRTSTYFLKKAHVLRREKKKRDIHRGLKANVIL